MKTCRTLTSLVVLCIACIVASASLCSCRAKAKTAAEVSAALADFVNQPELPMMQMGSRESTLGKIRQYQSTQDGERAVYDLDPQGEVVGFMKLGAKSKAVRLELEQAQALAAKFAKENYPDPSLVDQQPEQAGLLEGQEDRKVYHFRWVRHDPRSGAVLPQLVDVQVDAGTGEVVSFTRLFSAVTIDTQPAVDRAQAEQTVLETLQDYLNQPAVDSALLVVTQYPFDGKKGKQMLLWEFTVHGSADAVGLVPQGSIYVDAQSGEILEIVPSQ